MFDSLYALEPATDDHGDPQPVLLPLTPASKAAWIEFYNAHAQEQVELTGDLAAAWSKLEGYAARLALVVHCVRWAVEDRSLGDADAIDEESVRSGVVLSNWFGHEARRVYAMIGESDEQREHRRLVELIDRKGGTITPRELMRSSSAVNTAEAAEAALEALVRARHGEWETAAPGPKGGRPTRRFRLFGGADVDETPSGGPAGQGSVNVSAVSTPVGATGPPTA